MSCVCGGGESRTLCSRGVSCCAFEGSGLRPKGSFVLYGGESMVMCCLLSDTDGNYSKDNLCVLSF